MFGKLQTPSKPTCSLSSWFGSGLAQKYGPFTPSKSIKLIGFSRNNSTQSINIHNFFNIKIIIFSFRVLSHLYSCYLSILGSQFVWQIDAMYITIENSHTIYITKGVGLNLGVKIGQARSSFIRPKSDLLKKVQA